MNRSGNRNDDSFSAHLILSASDSNRRYSLAGAKFPTRRQNPRRTLGTCRCLLQSAALLWHDDLDGSHEISQGIQTADGSFLHGIMHRREPDNSNAKYWFRRVGDHPTFPALATAVRDFASADSQESQTLRKSGQASGEFDFVSSLIPKGHWDAFAFVDACHRVMNQAESPSSAEIQKPLQRIQELEFQTLLNHFLS